MAGTKTLIETKSGSQLLYITSGLAVFSTLPKDSITGERIEGEFANSAFRPKLRTTPALAEEIVAITGPVSTEAKVRAAFEKLKVKAGTAAPKKAKATATPKSRAQRPAPQAPSADVISRAQFDAAMRIMADLQKQLATKAA